MSTRRTYLKAAWAAGAATALAPAGLLAAPAELPLITRPIPRTGERLPAVGLGTSASFSRAAEGADTGALRTVLEALVADGGTLLDTAPGYGRSEQVAGEVARAAGLTDTIFWATKLNVAAGGGKADVRTARAQLDTSIARLGKRPLDLVQVHNMGDPPTQLAILREYQRAKRLRYLGITTTFPSQYAALERVMQGEPLDFIGVDYAIDNRTMEERIFPLACDQGIAVLVYAPFGRTRLWQTVRSHALPDWAAEFDAHTWGQFLLKFVISHPVVTVATPATSSAAHMADNLQGARGRLPNAAMRQRMIDYVRKL